MRHEASPLGPGVYFSLGKTLNFPIKSLFNYHRQVTSYV